MREKGVRFLPLYGRQSFEIDGKVRSGAASPSKPGAGPGLIDSLTDIARKSGVEIRYGAHASGLEGTPDGFGIRLGNAPGVPRLDADAVVLACGGFESNPAWRARYLGPGWDLAKVRGTRFNTGDGIRMAVGVGGGDPGQLFGLPCCRMGYERTRVRRSGRGRQLPEALLPVRHRGEPRRTPVCRRGGRFPQLHLRAVRTRDTEPSRVSALGSCSMPRSPTCCATSTVSAR